MNQYRERIQAECELVEATLSLLAQTMRRPVLEKPDWMAAAGFVFNAYTGIENILRSALRGQGIAALPSSPTSHRDLIDMARDRGVIDGDLSAEIDDYRAFRHFFSHGYGVTIDPDQLLPLIDQLPAVWSRFQESVLDSLPE